MLPLTLKRQDFVKKILLFNIVLNIDWTRNRN
jgi:hypothetical protein